MEETVATVEFETGQRAPLDVSAMEYGEATSLVSTQDMGALALSVFLLLLFAYTGRKLARWEGMVLLLSYGVYMALSFGLLPRLGGF